MPDSIPPTGAPRCTWLVPDEEGPVGASPSIECGEPARWLAYAPPGVAVGPQWHPTCDGHREHTQVVGWQLFPLPMGPDRVEAEIVDDDEPGTDDDITARNRFVIRLPDRLTRQQRLVLVRELDATARRFMTSPVVSTPHEPPPVGVDWASPSSDDLRAEAIRRIGEGLDVQLELLDAPPGAWSWSGDTGAGSGDYVVDADGDEQPRTHPTDVSTAAPGAVCGAWHTEHPEQPCDREPHHDPDDWHSHTGGMSWRDPEHTVTSRDYQRAFPPFTAPRGPVKFRAELTAGDVQQVLYKYARQHGADSRQAHDLSRHLEQQAADPLGTIDTEVRNAQARMAMADASWLDLADVLSLHPDVEADDVWETKADIVEFVRGLVLADCEILDHDGGVTITDVDLDAAIETWLGQAGMARDVAEQVAGQLVHLITGCVNVSASESSDLDTVIYSALRYHLGENELTEQVSGALWLLGAQGRLVQQGATMRWGGGGGREGQTSLIPAATTTVPPGTPFAVVVTRAELPL